MARRPKITFSGFEPVAGPILVALVAEDLAAPAGAATAFPGLQGVLDTLAKREKFTGKAGTTLELVLPGPDQPEKLILVGIGKVEEAGNRTAAEWKSLGGKIAGLAPKSRALVIAADGADGEKAADLALGFQLALYKFDRYKTKKNGEEGDETTGPVTIQLADAAAAKRAIKRRDALQAGVILARDLVNEPPNVLHPEEFADRVQRLDKLDVTVLDEKALKKIGMRALLGVGQGSAFESRVVIMVWNGAKDPNEKPLAFVGKGVTFDTGGISIKPAQGMEDMKGDMAGAAAVVGLMHALAERAAKVNAIGIIGLVENMPDGSAQRPGDIVTSLSGQTIEIINTDAEGRLVLGDLLWYVQDKYQPQFMINLATLTGAILVALGQEHAGLFSNDDALAEKIAAAGKSSGEKVWRMPLGKDYDKQIDSKFADMKNTGGRNAGSITAAQFLQRFVNETPWAHLDIAGTAMASPASDINKSWASGWGVQLLDALVAENYEK